MNTTSNPTAAKREQDLADESGSDMPDESHDEELALATSSDCNINEEEHVRLLVGLVEETVTRSQGSNGSQEIDGNGAAAALLQHLLRSNTSPPSNFHQVTVFVMVSQAPEDADLKTTTLASLVLGSFTIVLAQVATAAAIFFGANFPACEHNDMCDDSHACMKKSCIKCGTAVPLPIQTDAAGNSYNYYRAPAFVGYNTTGFAELCTDPVATRGIASIGEPTDYNLEEVTNWCLGCFTVTHESRDGIIDTMTSSEKATEEVDSMGFTDWGALLFAMTVVALSMSGELMDIEICKLTINSPTHKITGCGRLVVSVLSGLRRWVFLPCVLSGIMALIFQKGADALSVCFNTVAVLFLWYDTCSTALFPLIQCIRTYL
eukprot:COSAG02_NODE_340_length_24179_cov_6.401644_15_plen_376_part_00